MTRAFTSEFLRDMRREVWRLRRLGCTFREIATITGLAFGTVQSIGDPPTIFQTVTRIHGDGGAEIVSGRV